LPTSTLTQGALEEAQNERFNNISNGKQSPFDPREIEATPSVGRVIYRFAARIVASNEFRLTPHTGVPRIPGEQSAVNQKTYCPEHFRDEDRE
jgi:hypothetical protein